MVGCFAGAVLGDLISPGGHDGEALSAALLARLGAVKNDEAAAEEEEEEWGAFDAAMEAFHAEEAAAKKRAAEAEQETYDEEQRARYAALYGDSPESEAAGPEQVGGGSGGDVEGDDGWDAELKAQAAKKKAKKSASKAKKAKKAQAAKEGNEARKAAGGGKHGGKKERRN